MLVVLKMVAGESVTFGRSRAGGEADWRWVSRVGRPLGKTMPGVLK